MGELQKRIKHSSVSITIHDEHDGTNREVPVPETVSHYHVLDWVEEMRQEFPLKKLRQGLNNQKNHSAGNVFERDNKIFKWFIKWFANSETR